MFREGLELKPPSKLSALWATPSVAAGGIDRRCAVLGCGLVYVILIAML